MALCVTESVAIVTSDIAREYFITTKVVKTTQFKHLKFVQRGFKNKEILHDNFQFTQNTYTTLSQVTQKSLRQVIGVVPQDTVLFNDTIR